jgi:hypothetical protein
MTNTHRAFGIAAPSEIIEEVPAVQYPDITVQLSGSDGNAFAIIGNVARAIQRAKGREAADEYRTAAMACGSYDELLVHAMRTVDVE